MTKEKNGFSKTEFWTLITLYLNNNHATKEEISKRIGLMKSSLTAALMRLTKKGIVKPLRPSDIIVMTKLGILKTNIPLPNTKSYKEVATCVYILNEKFEDIIDKYPVILKYASTLFGVKTKEELIQFLNELKSKR